LSNDLPWSVVVVGMPRITGDICATVATVASRAGLRILCVSPDRDPQRIADVLFAGADDFLAYPFDPDELGARILLLASRIVAPQARQVLGSIALDYQARTIAEGARQSRLSRREWDALVYLLRSGEPRIREGAVSVAQWGALRRTGKLAAIVCRLRKRLARDGISAVHVLTAPDGQYTAWIRESKV
jgi:DNA-binding response OmpR family regulator